MKKILLPFLCLFVMSMPALAQMTPGEYNYAIIGEQRKIGKLMREMATRFEKNVEKAEKIRVKLVKQCETSLQKVKKLPDYKGNTKFRDAAIDVYAFYAELGHKDFKEMIDILKKGKHITVADLTRLTEIEKDIAERGEPLDDALEQAQNAFAAEHNLRLDRE